MRNLPILSSLKCVARRNNHYRPHPNPEMPVFAIYFGQEFPEMSKNAPLQSTSFTPDLWYIHTKHVNILDMESNALVMENTK